MTEIRKLEPLPIEREDCCVELDDLRERAAKARLEGMEEAARICDGLISPTGQSVNMRDTIEWCAAAIRAKANEDRQ